MINIQPQFGSLAPGIYQGSVRILLANGTLSIVSVVGVVATPASAAIPAYALDADAERPNSTGICSPIGVTFSSPLEGTRIPAEIPLTITLTAVDACHNPVSFPVKVPVDFIDFTNSSQIVFLSPSATPGSYTADFTFPEPTSGATPVILHSAPNAGLGITVGTALRNVIVIPSTGNQTTISPGGILNAGSFLENGVVAPGSWISIFANNLGDGLIPASSASLTCQLRNAQVQVGALAYL
jgi:hypothetical protein